MAATLRIVAIACIVAGSSGSAIAQRPPATFSISEETTFILAPQKPDGRLDYLTALNDRYRKGMRTDENAAVALWTVMGSSVIPENDRPAFFAKLGMSVVPESKLVSATDWSATRGLHVLQFERALESAIGRPWTRDTFPMIAAWLDANQDPLDDLVKASHRPRFYSPPLLSSAPALLIGADCPDAKRLREVTRALLARGMLRLGTGDVDASWQDIIAVYRWSRLLAQGPFLLQYTSAVAIQRQACTAVALHAHHAGLSTRRAELMLQELTAFGAPASPAEQVNVCERFMFLDGVQSVALDGLDTMLVSAGVVRGPEHESIEELLEIANWDRVLRLGNRWYDELSALIAQKSTEEQYRRLGELQLRVRQLDIERSDPATPPSQRITEHMAQSLFTLTTAKPANLIELHARVCVHHESARMALALEAHRSRHGQYPDSLSRLTPAFLAESGSDSPGGRSITYQRIAEGYRLVSPGTAHRSGISDGRSEAIILADTTVSPSAAAQRTRPAAGPLAGFSRADSFIVITVLVALIGGVVIYILARRRRLD